MGRIKLWIEGLIHRPFSKDAESSSGSSPDIAGDHPSDADYSKWTPTTGPIWTILRGIWRVWSSMSASVLPCGTRSFS